MAKDILLDETGDLLIENGDFVIGESSQQHVQDMLLASPGGNKAAPLFGVGLIHYLHGPGNAGSKQKLKKNIEIQLKADGATQITVDVGSTIKVEAKYE